MHPKKQLTREEFSALLPHLSARSNKEALFAVMVEGRSQADVARQFNVTRKAVSQSVGKAWQLHCERGDRPEGWESVNVALPPDLAEIVRDMARKARARLADQEGRQNENSRNR